LRATLSIRYPSYKVEVAIVGIVPAAGYATRLQPLPCSKEVYPIGGRPVMDYLVERMRLAGSSEIRVVTRPEKLDVVDNASRHGVTVVEGNPRSLAESFFTGMKGIGDDDIALLGFPDSIWEPPDGYSRVIDLLGDGCEVALGLFHTSEPQRCEVVTLREAGADSGLVARIELRPPAPTSNIIWGCAAAPASILRGLEREREPGEYFNRLTLRGAVAGVWLSDTYIDIGTREGLREALAIR
jgi:glucose-1-phosphate thymidylyltransferase